MSTSWVDETMQHNHHITSISSMIASTHPAQINRIIQMKHMESLLVGKITFFFGFSLLIFSKSAESRTSLPAWTGSGSFFLYVVWRGPASFVHWFQGLIPRARLLLTIGGTFFLGFGPLILVTVAFFSALYFVSSPFFICVIISLALGNPLRGHSRHSLFSSHYYPEIIHE